MSHVYIPESAWDDAAAILEQRARLVEPLEPERAAHLREIAHALVHGQRRRKRSA